MEFVSFIPTAGFVLALLVQTFYLVRWGSQMQTRVTSLEKEMERRDTDHRAFEAELNRADNRLVRMETLMEGIGTRLTTMEGKLDRTFDAISSLSVSVRVLNDNALRANVTPPT
jgi:uncharacterized protein YoxC